MELKSFLILPFSFFLYDLFINKVKKLEVAVSNPIMDDIPVSFSFFQLGLLSILYSFTFYLFLSHTISLSLSLSLSVDAALQLMLCSVMSSSLILIINEL